MACVFDPNGNRRRDFVRRRGDWRLRHDLRARSGTAPVTTSCCRSDDLATGSRRGSVQRILYLEAPSEIVPPGVIVTITANWSSKPRIRSAISMPRTWSPRATSRRLRHPRPEHGPDHRGPLRHHRSTSSAGTATSGRSGSTSVTSSRSPGGSISRRRSTRRSRRATSSSVRSFPASSTTTAGDPGAVQPLEHQRDEVIYYVAGKFMSRRGVDIASFTLDPAGIPHGPHPGTVEASIGKEATEELAVMVEPPPAQAQPGCARRRRSELHLNLVSLRGPREGSLRARERSPEAFPD